ncbi:hypothetical protein [Fibrella forsythiae]|uniref:Uncharacterized protein n=1 Tax=Fibrella forsythiae TaxID=2817061 RepID=A0ABS3JKU3_9BACT|nr:hypothetical protein [Fibrella forsythiae]MBO0950615.1 hypothetical protein [Fibrella forsythiae]
MPYSNYDVQETFAKAYKAVRVIETLENYVVADQTEAVALGGQVQPIMRISDEAHFWRIILTDPVNTLDRQVSLDQEFTLSEWVPRIPGLWWNKEATQRRRNTWDGRPVYDPYSKSKFVQSGVGTNLFGPDTNGQRIVSISSGSNASAGIPLLISNGMWNRLNLETGNMVKLDAVRWQRMAQEWTQRFESIKGIPHAYLCIDNESQIRVTGLRSPPIFQPYSLIEYVYEDALLYDYVFCNASVHNYQQEVANFFENYKRDFAYNGRYLINPDPTNPLFETAYSSPDHLRQVESGGRYHLAILKERVRQAYFQGRLLEDIYKILSQLYTDSRDISRIAIHLGFSVTLFSGNRPADRIAQLVGWCLDTPSKMDELIDKLSVENPELLAF